GRVVPDLWTKSHEIVAVLSQSRARSTGTVTRQWRFAPWTPPRGGVPAPGPWPGVPERLLARRSRSSGSARSDGEDELPALAVREGVDGRADLVEGEDRLDRDAQLAPLGQAGELGEHSRLERLRHDVGRGEVAVAGGGCADRRGDASAVAHERHER